jgi:hypothetical protein
MYCCHFDERFDGSSANGHYPHCKQTVYYTVEPFMGSSIHRALIKFQPSIV